MNTRSYSLIRSIVYGLMVLGVAAALPMNDAYAQGMGTGRPVGMGGTDRFAVAPKVGEQMPDLHIFDDIGNPVSIREITSDGENYSVLTLGCLT
jgi:hypothetical protein